MRKEKKEQARKMARVKYLKNNNHKGNGNSAV